MGKFTKDKRVTKNSQYSKNVLHFAHSNLGHLLSKGQRGMLSSQVRLQTSTNLRHLSYLLRSRKSSWSLWCSRKLESGLSEKVRGKRVFYLWWQNLRAKNRVCWFAGNSSNRQCSPHNRRYNEKINFSENYVMFQGKPLWPCHLWWGSRHYRFSWYGSIYPIATVGFSSQHNNQNFEKRRQFCCQNL